MNKAQISNELLLVEEKNIDFDTVLSDVSLLKKSAVAVGDEKEAKELWILEQIAEIHKKYQSTFSLLKNRSYYDAWCELERIEIKINALKPHFLFNDTEYKLHFVEKCVYNLQAIYPYRYFLSSELIHEEEQCSICGTVISIRGSCNHKVGEVYMGEYCYRNVTKWKFLSAAIVQNPVHKYSVPFATDSNGEKVDHYNYTSLDYLYDCVEDPYENWDVEISLKYIPHERYRDTGRNDSCPCGSTDKYKRCCLNSPGVKMEHHEFILKNPSNKKIIQDSISKSISRRLLRK